MKTLLCLLLVAASVAAQEGAVDSSGASGTAAAVAITGSSGKGSSEAEGLYGTKSALGFTGGTTSGIGFAYRKHFNNRWGVHAGFFVMGGSEEADSIDLSAAHSWIWGNVGAQAMYTIHRHPQKYFRFYALAGGEVIVLGDDLVESTGPATWSTQGDWDYEKTFIVGAGLGFEFLFFSHVALAIELPLSAQFTEHGFGIWPIPNGSLLYFF